MLRLHFIYVAFSTVVKLVGAIIPGVVISRFLGAPIKSEQGFSFITLRIFLSCMLFANLCHDVSPSLLKSYFWAVVMSLVPMVLGILSSLLVRKMVPQEWRVLLVLGSTFQNGLAFPLSVVSNIKGVSWLDSRGITVCQQYVFLYNLTCAIGLWSIGSLMVKHYKDKLIEKHEEMLEEVYFDALNEEAARMAQQAYASAVFGAPVTFPEDNACGGGVVPPPNTPYLTPFSRGWSEVHDDFTSSLGLDGGSPPMGSAPLSATGAGGGSSSVIVMSPFSRNGSLSRMGTELSFSSGVMSPIGGLRTLSPQESISWYRPCRRHPRPIDLRKYKKYVENGEELPSSKSKRCRRRARQSKNLSITVPPQALSSMIQPSSTPPYSSSSTSSSRGSSKSSHGDPNHSSSITSHSTTSSCSSCSRTSGNSFARARHSLQHMPSATHPNAQHTTSMMASAETSEGGGSLHPPNTDLPHCATMTPDDEPGQLQNTMKPRSKERVEQEPEEGLVPFPTVTSLDKADVERVKERHHRPRRRSGTNDASRKNRLSEDVQHSVEGESHDPTATATGSARSLSHRPCASSPDVVSQMQQSMTMSCMADNNTAAPTVTLNSALPLFTESSTPNGYTPAPETEDLEMHLRDRSFGVRFQHVWEMVKFVLQTPPITLSLIGIVVALVPPFRWLGSTAVGAAVIGGFEVIGAGCVPVQLITLGIILSPNNIKVDTNVVPSPGMNDPGGEEEERRETEARDLAAARMATTFGFLLLPLRWLRRMWQRIPPAVRLSILCLSLRLFILPAFAFFIVHVLVETGVMPSDKLFVFAILIGISSPAAVNASLVCTMHSYYPRQFAKMILTMYCVAAITSTFWISVSITYANHMH